MRWDPGRALRAAACIAVLILVAGLWVTVTGAFGDRTRALLLTIYSPVALAGVWALVRFVETGRTRERRLVARLEAESNAGKQLCIAAIESLAYAVEGRTSYNLGHLSRVQAYTVAVARELGLSPDEIDGLRIASLVHDIGRLGVPDNILVKEGALTEVEREKVQAYPILGGRLLATIPFPWPVVPVVRHHREHFDGSGYPDGLSGDEIPLGSRILAVVDAYDALVHGGSYRSGQPAAEAMVQIERAAGSQFDPQVVSVFRSVVDRVNAEIKQAEAGEHAHSAAFEIARAQREVQALYELACSVGTTLCLDDTLQTLARRILTIVSAATCVIYLHEEDTEFLHAYAAFGMNHWFFRRSRARIGTYLTGRVASRGEAVATGFMPDDIQLRHTPEPWTPLRSTLIVPLKADGQVIGTINLYHVEPDAFQPDDMRVMIFVGELAGRALKNARLFAQTQETAFTDAVTGLKNRRFLRQFLEQELNRARKNNHPIAVLGLDLDRFKPVNDLYGHERGDQVLREIGQLLQSMVRNYDLAARYAGDEFAIVLPETYAKEAEVVARKIKAAVDKYAEGLVEADPAFPRIGVSVGVATFPEDATDAQGLLACADQVMYGNKRAERSDRDAA
jgi:diguanylate cyclase (GGDEF)-like protein